MTAVMIWSITAGTIAGVLFRPKDWPEAVWACLGATLIVLLRLISPAEAASAIAKGYDVYLFLAGMMLLADLARRQGVFDWLASLAIAASKGSANRLFGIVYAVGILVTVFLSNDATAVVLTPAVYTAVRRARVPALPYMFICAFVANAASFVLPISNPANLVMYGRQLPPLVPWLRTFAIPSVCAIAATYVALRWRSAHHLSGHVQDDEPGPSLTNNGRLALWGLGITALALIACSARGLELGLPTCALAVVTVLVSTRADTSAIRHIVSEVSWSVLPLVAGLFVIVQALNKAGAVHDIVSVLGRLAAMPAWAGALVAAFGVTVLCNVMNNLPAGLLTGSAIQAAHVASHVRDALLVGVDLGPNLSVTGSLATLLWLIALRRESEHVSAWTFLKMGFFVTVPALLLSAIAVAFTAS
jgi:arsenical pump membrane protein